MDLSWLMNRVEDIRDHRENFLEKVRSMTSLIDRTIQTVQKISSELRPGLLDDLGLSAALEWQAQEFQNRTGITCVLLFDDSDLKINSDCATALFRIFQEALTNVARHSQATRVEIDLKEGKDTVRLTIIDNGRGISDDEIHSPKSLGIIGMRERLRPFNGKLRMKGQPQKGTTTVITIPKKEYL
jgi:two-component system sensor histidine kinase UhpB